MRLSMFLAATRHLGLIILLSGTRSTCQTATYTPPISSSITDIRINSNNVISDSNSATLPNTMEATMTLSTSSTATPRTSTPNTDLFEIKLNTSCVTGQLLINRSQFNELAGSRNVSGTCEGDNEFIKTFIDHLINGVKQTTTTTPLTAITASLTTTPQATTTAPLITTDPTTPSTSDDRHTGSSQTSTSTDVTSTSSTTTAIDTTSTKLCEEHLLRGVGIGAAAVALPFIVILVLCIFRRNICSNGCNKKTDDASGTGNTETEVDMQRLHDDLNSTSGGRDTDAETDVSRPGYGNTGFPNSDLDSIPALPRKTSIFSIHEDDEDILGSAFNRRSAPESDYDQLPSTRKPLEAKATDAGDDEDDQPEYVNVLEARDGQSQNDQEEYTNFPAISI
ncbi:protein let-653-like isoform X2 [Haliotis asinina]